MSVELQNWVWWGLVGVVAFLVIVIILMINHNRHQHRIMHYKIRAKEELLNYLLELFKAIGGAARGAVGLLIPRRRR